MKRKLLLRKFMRLSFFMFCFLGIMLHVDAQDVRFTSVNPTLDVLTITNPGVMLVDLTNYQLCLGPGTYVQIGTLTPVNGSIMLAAGEKVTLPYSMDDTMDGLSLFSNSNFGSSNPTDLIAYVQWGAGNQPRVGQAVTAGRWDNANNFVSGMPPYTTTTGGSAASWNSCDVNGGAIQITGSTDTTATICVGEGINDLIDVEFNNSISRSGSNASWVITDQSMGEILGLPASVPSGGFNLEGAGPGICDIWYLRYEDGVTGLAVGQNISGLSGCFDLSNAISVTRLTEPDCDALSIDDFETDFNFVVYPNPAQNMITIDYRGNLSLDLGVQVIDMLGKQSEKVNFSTGQNMTLDLNLLSFGTYFLSITDNNSGANVVKRVIKN